MQAQAQVSGATYLCLVLCCEMSISMSRHCRGLSLYIGELATRSDEQLSECDAESRVWPQKRKVLFFRSRNQSLDGIRVVFCNHRTRELESIVKDKNIGKRTYLSDREAKRSSQLRLHGEMPRNPDSLPIKKKRNGLGHIVASDNSTILIQSRGQRSSTMVLNHRVASHHRPSHRNHHPVPWQGKSPR